MRFCTQQFGISRMTPSHRHTLTVPLVKRPRNRQPKLATPTKHRRQRPTPTNNVTRPFLLSNSASHPHTPASMAGERKRTQNTGQEYKKTLTLTKAEIK